MPAEVVKEDSGLYSSPGAELVAVGDQVLQEEVGEASSWDQFSTGELRVQHVCVVLVWEDSCIYMYMYM